MTRHSKNATAGPTYTYYEKTKDCRQSGYGTKEVRLGKDAIKVNYLFSLVISTHPQLKKETFFQNAFFLVLRISIVVRSACSHASIQSSRKSHKER